MLRFTPESPAGRDEPPEVQSSKTPNSQRIVIVAKNAPGRYKYDIQANGITVDPAIIID